MCSDKNRRETGATKYPGIDQPNPSDQFSQDAAENKKPAGGMGLTRKQGEVEEETHQSDGQNPSKAAKPSPATQKVSGAGPATAEHSKDAKAPKAGRQSGTYIKD
ncbi:MAG: hypothetical protein J0I79_25580 [Mesorhizobium sp.]|nr:hypothetical protein [Mesorhizobium sp.]